MAAERTTETPSAISMDDSYDEYPRIEEAFQALLDESLNPRGPASLWDLLDALAPTAGSTAVDVGCGEGDDAIALHQRYGVNVIGVDPVDRHIELGTAAAADAGVDNHVTFRRGTAEHVPVPDSSIDLLWCKEVLMYTDLERAFAEFRRLLRPGGRGFVYQVFTGDEMTDDEADAYWGSDGLARSVRADDVQASLAATNLRLIERIDLGSEWGEYAQERSGAGGRRLVHLARLRRDPQRYISAFGEKNYRIMLGDCLWHVYRMIGKIQGAVFTFERSP